MRQTYAGVWSCARGETKPPYGKVWKGKSMNFWLVSASIVSVVTFGIHVFAGGPMLHAPLLRSALHPVAKSVWSVVWHAVSALIALNAVAYFLAARSGVDALTIAAYPLASSLCAIVLFLFYGITRLGNLTQMPQWTLFLASSALAVVGLFNT
jgi:hypothetical protein